MPSQTSTSPQAANQVPEFHQMADGMKKAIDEFDSSKTSDVFAMMTSYLAPVGDVAISGWRTCTGFVRRHPVETSVAVGALGLLTAYMLIPSSETENVKRSKRKSAKNA